MTSFKARLTGPTEDAITLLGLPQILRVPAIVDYNVSTNVLTIPIQNTSKPAVLNAKN